MTILDSAYSLAKDIKASDKRTAIRALIEGLNTRKEEDEDDGRAYFGYFARNFYKQFEGYLYTYYEKEGIEKQVPYRKISVLSDDELNLITSAHSDIVHLNLKCIESICDEIQDCHKTTVPYNYYLQAFENKDSEPSLFSTKARDAFVASFATHPGIQLIHDYSSKMIPGLQVNEIFKLASAISSILRLPPKDPRVSDFFHDLPPATSTSPESNVFRVVCALVCIRASLEQLDQLLFQACLYDKLQVLDDNCIMKIGSFNDGITGMRGTIVIQPIDSIIRLQPAELVLVKSPEALRERHPLYQIEGAEFGMSQEFGESVSLNLRGVDEHLDPYSSMLRIISQVPREHPLPVRKDVIKKYSIRQTGPE